MSFIFHSVNPIIVCFFCVLMPRTAGSQFYEIHPTMENNAFDILTVEDDSYCGDTQKMVNKCFKDVSPHLMEFLETTNTSVNNKDELVSKCTVFKLAMRCFDRYTERCLPKKDVFHYQNNVADARKFLSKFCDNRRFQEEYIRNKECFFRIQKDWKRCNREFQNVLFDEFSAGSHSKNITNKYMEFCCARHAYETCIYRSVRLKCDRNPEKFSARLEEVLPEEKLFSSCKKYEHLLCSIAPKTYAGQNLNLVFVFSMLVVIYGRKMAFI